VSAAPTRPKGEMREASAVSDVHRGLGSVSVQEEHHLLPLQVHPGTGKLTMSAVHRPRGSHPTVALLFPRGLLMPLVSAF
jgi:hypothetical protein